MLRVHGERRLRDAGRSRVVGRVPSRGVVAPAAVSSEPGPLSVGDPGIAQGALVWPVNLRLSRASKARSFSSCSGVSQVAICSWVSWNCVITRCMTS